ncbi:uncharacterized protein [Syngnathus scovelli]|uniref:uncharacterized protein isoform X2 n=1 Tax=Syngnathus scovelli TaxID=161590 RepID=UPI00210F2A34|nr:uncharacterized protein LOC125970315 isoform X2 [Syngnathus scovelli]
MQRSGELPPGSAVRSRPARGLRHAYVRAGFGVGGHGSQRRGRRGPGDRRGRVLRQPVWDKYPDGNAWLGERGYRTTTYSIPGEWPVSYHGTSKNGARAIIVTNYQPGPGQKYGRGVYSTPSLEHAAQYTRTFQSSVTGKNYRVVMQNRVNPAYREKHNGGEYWLLPVPDGLTQEQEQDLVEKAIRPYAVLIKPL